MLSICIYIIYMCVCAIVWCSLFYFSWFIAQRSICHYFSVSLWFWGKKASSWQISVKRWIHQTDKISSSEINPHQISKHHQTSPNLIKHIKKEQIRQTYHHQTSKLNKPHQQHHETNLNLSKTSSLSLSLSYICIYIFNNIIKALSFFWGR